MSDLRDQQRRRIVEVASRLAAEHGFEGVALRDVAAEAGLALGTLYKSFRNKEEMLGAVVAGGIASMRASLGDVPRAPEPADRVIEFFERFTRVVARYPAIARALLEALASRRSALVAPILKRDEETALMIASAIRGARIESLDDCTEDELEVAMLLRQLWFASMIGWAAEMHSLEEVEKQVAAGARRLL